MNVIDIIVKNDYCIGCGVCAGICPSNNLYMDWSIKGELVPYHNDHCKDKCSICLDVCPFYDHDNTQESIANSLFAKNHEVNYNRYTGYYLDCFVGFQKDKKKRLKSASGGLATSFLSTLIEEKIVDKIIAVGMSDNSDRLFDFRILSNSNEVYSCAGSFYYPVEISKIIKKILTEREDMTYAIIALPCVVYALRLAIEKIPKLKRKIKIISSLTCGQLQNRFFSELLALESGIKVDELSKIDFRRKEKSNEATNYLHVAISKKGHEGIPQANLELPFHLWHYHYFKQNSCNYCDDVFGELADVTFMDAWLPEYIKEYRGTSLIISRIPLVKELLERDQRIYLKRIDVKKVVESQNGVIKKKRILLRGKLYQKEISKDWYPKKRVEPDAIIYDKYKRFINLTEETQIFSKKIWARHRLDKSTESFWKDMSFLESKISRYELKLKMINLIKLPFKII